MGVTVLRWYLNDLSLQGQFASASAFVDVLGNLARLRRRVPGLETQLYCSRALGERPVTIQATCRDAVMSTAPREAKIVILTWISKYGPFLDDDRQPEEDDCFEFEGHDVTNQGLGESARRVRVGEEAGVFSFLGGPLDFERDPLTVQHGLLEAPLGLLDIDNVWQASELEARARATIADPKNWPELVEACRSRFDRLLVPDAILDRLVIETFYPVVANRILVILGILQQIMEGRAENGSLNEAARSLWLTHSHGDTALFSDESTPNKRRFRNEMTFPDPGDPSRSLFCPWHGKIQTPQFRIHFEWPVPVGQTALKILYIGPKITKN
jgi:hypothetical protein